MQKNPTVMWVVAAALMRADGRVLMQRRPADKMHGGLWEFPGGKVEPQETARAALSRELAEELGITVAEAELVPLGFADRSGEATVILLYMGYRWAGEPCATDGASICWFTLAEIKALAMPPLDVDLHALLSVPTARQQQATKAD